MQPVDAKPGELELAFSRLKRGLMTADEHVALSAYKQLYEAGSKATQILERELARFPLEETPKHPEAINLLAGLLTLQRDIDETASDGLIANALGHRCPDVVSALLRSVRRMSKNDFRRTKSGEIEIWEHVSLDCGYDASLHVREWLEELPESDRTGISRIVIVPGSLEKDWLGTYLPILGVVTLAWTTVVPPNSRLVRILNASHRVTLFHEVGHHVHKHWFGQDAEQERAADAYAARSARARMPIWLRTCLPLVGAISRLLGWCDAHPPSTRSKIARTRF